MSHFTCLRVEWFAILNTIVEKWVHGLRRTGQPISAANGRRLGGYSILAYLRRPAIPDRHSARYAQFRRGDLSGALAGRRFHYANAGSAHHAAAHDGGKSLWRRADG